MASSSVPWSCNPTVPSHPYLSLCRTSCGGCAWSFRPGCGLAWFSPCEICCRDVHRSMDPGTEPSPQMALLSHHVIPFPHTAMTTRNLSPCKVQMLQTLLFQQFCSCSVISSYGIFLPSHFHPSHFGSDVPVMVLHEKTPPQLHQRAAVLYLEGYLSCHGEPMCDDRLLLCCASLPAVQLHTAAARQEHLPVHLH